MQLKSSTYQAACLEFVHSAGVFRRTVCWQLLHAVQLTLCRQPTRGAGKRGLGWRGPQWLPRRPQS